jgi:hypothetical protein
MRRLEGRAVPALPSRRTDEAEERSAEEVVYAEGPFQVTHSIIDHTYTQRTVNALDMSAEAGLTSREVARSKYEVPAQHRTWQVIVVGAVGVAGFAFAAKYPHLTTVVIAVVGALATAWTANRIVDAVKKVD